MDKRKQNGKGGKPKNKRHGSNRRFNNHRSVPRSARVGNRLPAGSAFAAKVKDPVMELLAVLRMNPGIDGIRNIVQYVDDERADYTNLGKVVRSIIGRALTDEEETLVKRLGSNAGNLIG